MLTVAGHMLMMGSLAPVLALYASSFGVTEWAIGAVITVFGLGRLAVDIPAGLLAERIGRRALLWIGPAVAGVASVGAALTDSYLLLVACRFLQGVGSGIYMTVATIVCADLSTPADTRAGDGTVPGGAADRGCASCTRWSVGRTSIC